MDDEVLQWLLKGTAAVNAGPNAREIFRVQIEDEYNNGNTENSVFYQVMTLYQAFELRYLHSSLQDDEEPSARQLKDNFNAWEKKDFEKNPLMQFVYKELLAAEAAKPPPKPKKKEPPLKLANFLLNVPNPQEGIKRIESVCQEMPKEWTIIQLCKGPRPETSYSIFPRIHESGAAIYFTLLRHARSSEYPAPICIRFTGPEEHELFKKFAHIADRFKQSISVDPSLVQTKEAKTKYWKNLTDFETHITGCLSDFKSFFYPWLFLFTGSPSALNDASVAQYQRKAFRTVDSFCDTHHWEPNERVLLSLAALHVGAVSKMELEAVCQALNTDERQQTAAVKMLAKLQSLAAPPSAAVATKKSSSAPASTAPHQPSARKHNPCILIVDERLDHFYWEELNVEQEFSRVNSLQCLWRLQQLHKQRIRNGYLLMNIESGACLLNPDCNLKNTEMRMKTFVTYWTPHWLVKSGQKPTIDEMNKDFFKRDCFVYAGHGSGLQYINGKHIAKQEVNSVVFLFGCDSSRLRSNGLYSELIGAHLYYHAALCPTLVGTLLPGLDANMDTVATAILSMWIAPQSKSVLAWDQIDTRSWSKEGVIKAKSAKDPKGSTMADTPDYHVGSLCEIISRVHQRRIDAKLYNTIGYVCRGLPVWNCNVQPLPK